MAVAQPVDRSELMFLGKECHHPACHLNDFLPFSCPACKQTYCQPHFLPSHHQCSAPLPPSMVDRIAPQCPLCDSVVPTIPNRGPDEAVERHIMGGTCTGLEGGEARRKEELRRKKERGEVCFRKGCTKTLIVQLKCQNCNHLFCPTHRSSTSHTCSPSTTPSGSRTSTPQPPSTTSQPAKPFSRLLHPSSGSASSGPSKPSPSSAIKPSPVVPVTAAHTPTSTPLDARAAAAAAALKRAGQDVKVPFVKSKQDKRANAEVQSQIQALKARHDKGLLSKTEEVRYAELIGNKESARRKGSKGGKDGCVIG